MIKMTEDEYKHFNLDGLISFYQAKRKDAMVVLLEQTIRALERLKLETKIV
jgi:hypothetical protein